MLRQVPVVQPAEPIRQYCTHLTVQGTNQASLVFGLQPRVHILTEQRWLLASHPLEIREWDFQLLRELAPCQLRDSVPLNALLFRDPDSALPVVRFKTHER